MQATPLPVHRLRLAIVVATCLLATLLMATTSVAAGTALPNDPMEPIAPADGALTGPLSGALLVTRDLNTLRRAYVDGVGLTLEGPLALTRAQLTAQRRLWRLPAELRWQVYLLTRPSLPSAIRVLVIVPDRDTPVIRGSFDRAETGPYALGFPMRDVRAVDARVVALGLKRTLPAVNEYPLQLRDGTPYPVIEASYEVGDFNRLVILSRGGGLNQTGAIQADTGMGGPAYSSLIVDNAAAMEGFFTQVLDYERRTNREWTVFQPRFRYITLHARGARTGNLGLVEYDPTDRKAGSGIAPRPPNRGLAGWSFAVRDLDLVLRRARANNQTPLAPPLRLKDPRFGDVRMASLLAPNGLLIEIYQPLAAGR
jgi:catechol 2,3-dioxygenase-like lactoylglutathione lyase family enzyme